MHQVNNVSLFIRGVDTELTERTRLTEIRKSGPFSNFNSILRNLWVLKYKFETVTIVELDHILNFKKIALYMQCKLSFILFKKTLRQFDPFPSNRSLLSIWSLLSNPSFALWKVPNGFRRIQDFENCKEICICFHTMSIFRLLYL